MHCVQMYWVAVPKGAVSHLYHVLAVQIPLLDTPQGSVWESNAIARYLARQADKGLFGKTRIDEVSPVQVLAAALH